MEGHNFTLYHTFYDSILSCNAVLTSRYGVLTVCGLAPFLETHNLGHLELRTLVHAITNIQDNGVVPTTFFAQCLGPSILLRISNGPYYTFISAARYIDIAASVF